MKTVGVREFRDHATKYLASGEPFEVERHGQTIGYFIPSKRNRNEELKRGIAELNEIIEQILQQTGMTREEFEELMSTPAPSADDGESPAVRIAESRHAAGD